MGTLADKLDHPVLRRLFGYWDEKRQDRPYPARHEVDPLDLRFALGRLILIEVEDGPLRFRYRLYGSEVARQMGFDLTGRYTDQHPSPEFGRTITQAYRDLVLNPAAQVVVRHSVMTDKLFHHHSLLLPLGEGGRVTHILICVIFDPVKLP